MAELYPKVSVSISMDPTEAHINEKFDQLIVCLNHRREELIAEHREKQRERRTSNTSRSQTIQELNESRTHLQTEMKVNVLHTMCERIVDEIESKMKQLKVVEPEVELVFECDTQQLEEIISVLGQLVERVIVSVPNYPALSQPRISVGKRGTGVGNLYRPRGIAYDEETQLIYVTNTYLNLFSLIGSINVFSITGEYINTFCKGQLEYPVGIASNGDDIYVSDSNLHSVFRFRLPDFELINQVGKQGTTSKGEFSFPRQITIANDFVFVADRNNHRIVVMTNELELIQSVSHVSVTQPFDVKLLDTELYVLSYKDNPCLHVLSQSGEKLRSFITCGKLGNKQVKKGYFFCFDQQQNILISDFSDNSIKVFSQEGALLHTLGHTQEDNNRIKPKGIVVTNDNKIICTSDDTEFGLHIFY